MSCSSEFPTTLKPHLIRLFTFLFSHEALENTGSASSIHNFQRSKHACPISLQPFMTQDKHSNQHTQLSMIAELVVCACSGPGEDHRAGPLRSGPCGSTVTGARSSGHLHQPHASPQQHTGRAHWSEHTRGKHLIITQAVCMTRKDETLVIVEMLCLSLCWQLQHTDCCSCMLCTLEVAGSNTTTKSLKGDGESGVLSANCTS